ncbi:hypothetical protein TNCV_4958941 [Trichonephila clavipes]|uniref:Uncharacterized protein n=1 Tax=Trichonephila clavipes TaxID=2585209 RepID=A0A8X6VMT6_TRICX|nr:hypothetical protein TNCV_4958941 [Trichonephila clavipes]
MRFVVKYEWTLGTSVSMAFRPSSVKRPCLVKWLVADVACLVNEVREDRVKVAIPLHPLMKITLQSVQELIVLAGVGSLDAVVCHTNQPMRFSEPHRGKYLKQLDSGSNACRV